MYPSRMKEFQVIYCSLACTELYNSKFLRVQCSGTRVDDSPAYSSISTKKSTNKVIRFDGILQSNEAILCFLSWEIWVTLHDLFLLFKQGEREKIFSSFLSHHSIPKEILLPFTLWISPNCVFIFPNKLQQMKNLSLELLELIAANRCLSSKDKANLCQVSRVFYATVTHLLYKHIMINNPRQYLLLKDAMQNRSLAHLVHRLDFSSYTTRGSRWTEEKAKSIIVAEELADLIGGCDQLKELFVGEEMVHAFVSPRVIRSIFSHQNNLRTIDFTGFCDRNFTTVMADFFKPVSLSKLERLALEEQGEHAQQRQEEPLELSNWSVPRKLENISFYMCMALSQEHFFIPFFDKIRTSGNQLTRLDLAYTQITSSLFAHLQSTTTLTHLNLQGCHSLSCCSPLVAFLQNNCSKLIELNLNMDFNGIGGSRFCHDCIMKILKSTNPAIQSLDMGGHTNFDDLVLTSMIGQQHFSQLRQFSVAYCRNISLDALERFLVDLPNLFYLNLARTPLTIDLSCLPRVLSRLSKKIKVIEISPFTPKRYPAQLSEWKLSSQGRRTYYSRDSVDPKFVYSKKMLMLSDQILSPMNKYWCYSY